MRVAIHQPHYLPWLRYLDKIARSDCFVVLDDAQFNRNGWQNRNKIKGPDGALLLTAPVLHAYQQRICDVRFNDGLAWQKKHWRSLEVHYARSPFFETYRDGLHGFYLRPWDRLADLNRAMLDWLLEVLDIRTRVVGSRELQVAGTATPRLIEICRALGATEYLTGEHALGEYLQPQAFAEAGIALVAQRWECPQYSQGYPQAGFVPDLAILDLLLNEGPRSMEMLQSQSSLAEVAVAGFPA